MESYVYLLWTSPEWCRDGCCSRLRGAFLRKHEAESAEATLERDEPTSDHSFYRMRLGRVSADDGS